MQKANPQVCVGHNETVTWKHDGEEYMIHVQMDAFPQDPRDRSFDEGTFTTMACFHRRYNLGDEIDQKTPEEWWQSLVRQNVSNEELVNAIRTGKLSGLRIENDPEWKGCVDVYATYFLRTVVGNSEPAEELLGSGIREDSLLDIICDNLTIQHCMVLMQPHAECLPLWLYDHSGITMSCGERTGQYADQWDSMPVGWIIAMKDQVMTELRDYVLDENGDPIRVDRGNGIWDYKTVPLTEDTWRAAAIRMMEGEVHLYDQYLTDDVYIYRLYQKVDGKWEEDESEGWIGTFFGHDICKSGMADEVGLGLMDAIMSGDYRIGEAKMRTITVFEFT